MEQPALQILRDLAELRSWSAVSRRHQVTEAFCLQSIGNLESACEIEIIVRGMKQITLTPQGKILAQAAEEILRCQGGGASVA